MFKKTIYDIAINYKKFLEKKKHQHQPVSLIQIEAVSLNHMQQHNHHHQQQGQQGQYHQQQHQQQHNHHHQQQGQQR